MNGRTAINIPGDLPSPKLKTPPVVAEKRNSLRHEQKEQREHHREQRERERHQDREREREREHHNGAKVSNHHNNNNKVNSACLNNLILPLLSDVSRVLKLTKTVTSRGFYCYKRRLISSDTLSFIKSSFFFR